MTRKSFLIIGHIKANSYNVGSEQERRIFFTAKEIDDTFWWANSEEREHNGLTITNFCSEMNLMRHLNYC